MTCQVTPGCSGGAVLNANGELVGIISSLVFITNGFVRIPLTHISFYVPLLGVTDWLQNPPSIPRLKN